MGWKKKARAPPAERPVRLRLGLYLVLASSLQSDSIGTFQTKATLCIY